MRTKLFWTVALCAAVFVPSFGAHAQDYKPTEYLNPRQVPEWIPDPVLDRRDGTEDSIDFAITVKANERTLWAEDLAFAEFSGARFEIDLWNADAQCDFEVRLTMSRNNGLI